MPFGRIEVRALVLVFVVVHVCFYRVVGFGALMGRGARGASGEDMVTKHDANAAAPDSASTLCNYASLLETSADRLDEAEVRPTPPTRRCLMLLLNLGPFGATRLATHMSALC